jgi:WhiB family transcriptional regulator, redox-sensing transcriptional regulator
MSVRLETIGIFDWTTTEWMDRARCARTNPDVFFPGPSRRARVKVEQAKAICSLCAVRGECLKWAIETDQCCGVWGGASEDELRRMRRRNRRELIGAGDSGPLQLVGSSPLGPER